jgi:hypothetical protein
MSYPIILHHFDRSPFSEKIRVVFGQKRPREEMSADEALAIAAKAKPETVNESDPGDPNGRKVGDRVLVAPDDYGKVEVGGEIVSLSAQHIAIRRMDERVGEIVVHFPRAGFVVLEA